MIFYDSKGNEINLQEHEDTNWIKLNDIVYYRKVNRIVYVNVINSNIKTCTFGEQTLGVLPDGFKPSFSIPMYMFTKGISKDKNPMVDISVERNGTIRVYVPFETNHLYAYCSFPID